MPRVKKEQADRQTDLPERNQTPHAGNRTDIPDRQQSLRPQQDMEIDQPLTPNSNGDAASQDRTHEPSNEAETMHALTIDSRQLIQTIQKLDALNISTSLPNLPKFVVVGDQSAGKSSIVEALCNVMLPRNQGTCTRVPFLITTSARDTPWHCDVSLQVRYDYSESAQYTDAAFVQWTERPVRTVPYASVSDKAELGPVLDAAQRTLLDPSGIIEPYASGQPVNRQQVLFSPNIICLTITGPGLPELSFYDLPGSINTLPNEEDQHFVSLIEELVKDYIKSSAALIMLAVPANQDVETSTTFKFIRQCKAEARCLGVLTKPDSVERARLPYLSKMLDGATFKLGRGWYVTKQPSQTDLDAGITQAQARTNETAFFSGGPWSHELSRHALRVGTKHLQAAISSELRNHILDNIGTIVEHILKRINEIEHELAGFREKDAHPMMTVLKVIGQIRRSIAKNIDGGAEENGFRSELQAHKNKFRNELRTMGPDLDAATPATARQAGMASRDVIMLDDSDDEQIATPSVKRKAATPASASHSAKRVKREGTPAHPSKVVFTIPQIYDIRDKHTIASIPGHPDPKVTDVIIRRTLEGWSGALETFHHNVEELVFVMIREVLDQELAKFKRCALYNRSRQQSRRYLEPLFEWQQGESKRLLQRELHKPATLSDLGVVLKPMKEELARKRARKRIMEKWDAVDVAGGKVPSHEDKMKKLEEYKETLVALKLPADPHQSIIDVLALPFAYYQVALNRFADTVAMELEYEVIAGLGKGLEKALEDGLNTSDQAACDELLVEDDAIERERQRLLTDRARLQEAIAEVRDLRSI